LAALKAVQTVDQWVHQTVRQWADAKVGQKAAQLVHHSVERKVVLLAALKAHQLVCAWVAQMVHRWADPLGWWVHWKAAQRAAQKVVLLVDPLADL